MRDVSSESNKERTGKSEAVSSKRCLSFNLISPYTLERMALRKTVGKDKYGSVQWRIGINDAEYVTDRFNHFFQHLMDFMKEGNKHDDNIGGMLWGLECLSEVERLAPEALKYIVGISNVFAEVAAEINAEEKKHDKDYNSPVKRFVYYSYAPGVWVVKDLNYDLYLMYPAEKPAYQQCRDFNNSPSTAAGLTWLAESQIKEHIDANRGHRRMSDSSTNAAKWPTPLSNHTEPRFHTAKDTQVDTKSPDGTSEHWYIIDTVGKRRVRVYSNERLTAADRAAIECRNFNNGTNPDILTSWEPFPAI